MLLMNKKIYILVVLVSVLTGQWVFAQNKGGQQSQDFVPGVLIAKLKPSQSNFFKSDVFQKNKRLNRAISVVSTFPSKTKLEAKKMKSNPNLVDLSLIYSLNVVNSEINQEFIQALLDLKVFEYVERKPMYTISFTPNDPSLTQQNYFSQINASSAWDVTSGSALIKIGVVDTGTDMDHPDLQSEMAENTNDPINGIDDDNDGYTDNFTGWDFIDNDGTPQVGSGDHGIHVAGIAAAATNNGLGVASVGYNTQFMPVRVGDGVSIVYGYEGIAYAADMGCDIINCSWGGFGFSSYGEDIVNYATFNKDALVVCAAGNQNRNQKYYPAAFENAFAVSSVNSSDVKSSFTNHGYWVDIAAPGENIYSTVNDGNYNHNTGTSMAAPVVSGAAALVKAKYPQLSAMQIAERLRSTSAGIDGANPTYEFKLGAGRLNVGDAVSGNITAASVVFGNLDITNNTDDVFKGNDSLFISGTFTNYLNTSGNVVATISTNSVHVSINNDTENIGVLGSSVQVDNYTDPFSFKILNTAPLNTVVTFRVDVTDGVFNNAYLFNVLVNVDYLNIAINNIATSIGSKGQFGYNSRNQNQGLGVQYKNGVSQLFEGGLMIGTDQDGFVRVVDRVRNGTNSWDDDFKVVENIMAITPAPMGQYYVEGVFNDSNALADTIGLWVSQKAYASTDFGHENYVVVEYKVVNINSVDVNNVSIGLFADFDVADFSKNAGYTDLKRFYTYTISTEPNNPVFGIQLLTPSVFRSYCLDNVSGGNGGVDILSGFNNSKKYTTLTTNRLGAGFQDITGNDVIQVTSTGGFDLLPNDTVTVAFAIIAAEHKGLLDQVADSAYKRYNGVLPNSIHEVEILNNELKLYPNPVLETLIIDISQYNYSANWSVSILDVMGREVHSVSSITGNQASLNVSSIFAGVYLVEIQMGNGLVTTSFIKK
jgi:hypothetical protein